MLSIYILISLKLFITAVISNKKIKSFVTIELSISLLR